MKQKIGVITLLLLLLLSLLVVPVAGAADGGKALIKEMVQSPDDHSVGGVEPSPFYRLLSGDFWRFDSSVFLRGWIAPPTPP